MSDTSTPQSVGIIMDGNRRYAKERALSSIEGHARGAKKLKEVIAWALEQRIHYLLVYAFSTENWKRDAKEVLELMALFEQQLTLQLSELNEKVQIRFIGERNRFSPNTQKMMQKLEETSAGEGKPVLALALSYGGRADIVQGVNRLIADGATTVTEDLLSSSLATAGMPDPELIIRTGGEQRLSNFLTWQSVYSELLFTNTLWPALGKEEFDSLIESYRRKKRNFGA